MKIEIQRNQINGGFCCNFEYKGRIFYADKAWIPGIGPETMIFPCDKDGEVTSWSEVYCDRSDMSLEDCIKEFTSKQ